MKFGSRKPLTAGQQLISLQRNPICTGHGSRRPGGLSWQYRTSPSPLSREYAVRIEFQQGSFPKVFIDSPDLQALSDGRSLPHVYDQSPAQLCLFFPKYEEWQPWMKLDQTVVPWATLWLFYFEEWLDSDEWKGGGIHLPDRALKRNRREKSQRPGGAA
uniref:Type II CBASS E2 protein domain-containing protein n=1 Tax=Rhodopseudomonas palustris (strain BisA53) TaxID=316055 RepID=Q07NQ3_RHOP5